MSPYYTLQTMKAHPRHIRKNHALANHVIKSVKCGMIKKNNNYDINSHNYDF